MVATSFASWWYHSTRFFLWIFEHNLKVPSRSPYEGQRNVLIHLYFLRRLQRSMMWTVSVVLIHLCFLTRLQRSHVVNAISCFNPFVFSHPTPVISYSMNSISVLMSSVELAKDVCSAAALLERHKVHVQELHCLSHTSCTLHLLFSRFLLFCYFSKHPATTDVCLSWPYILSNQLIGKRPLSLDVYLKIIEFCSDSNIFFFVRKREFGKYWKKSTKRGSFHKPNDQHVPGECFLETSSS